MMDETTIRVAIRATARISFVLFLGAFLGNAFYSLVPAASTRWLKANKDGFTLGFAASHTVHLALILALMAAIGREHALKGIMVVAFTTGFLFIYGLAADVLFRLSFRGQLHATRNNETPFLHTACSRRCHRDWGKDRSFYPFERRASF